MSAANDNERRFIPALDFAVPGQALTLAAPHRRCGRQWAEFVSHAADGHHIIAKKLISGMWNSRWTKPMKVARESVIDVHDCQAR